MFCDFLWTDTEILSGDLRVIKDASKIKSFVSSSFLIFNNEQIGRLIVVTHIKKLRNKLDTNTSIITFFFADNPSFTTKCAFTDFSALI